MRRDKFNFFFEWNCSAFLEEIALARKNGRTIALANGVFDILHPGHLAVFEYAASGHRERTNLTRESFVVAAVNSDRSARACKGSDHPFLSQEVRLRVVAGLYRVDVAVLFDQDTPADLIQHVKPDVLVKGGDCVITTPVGAQWCRHVVFAPLLADPTSKDKIRPYHSSVLAGKISAAYLNENLKRSGKPG